MAAIVDHIDLNQNGLVEWKEFAMLMADRWLRQEGETDMQLALGLFAEDEIGDAPIQLDAGARPASPRARSAPPPLVRHAAAAAFERACGAQRLQCGNETRSCACVRSGTQCGSCYATTGRRR